MGMLPCAGGPSAHCGPLEKGSWDSQALFPGSLRNSWGWPGSVSFLCAGLSLAGVASWAKARGHLAVFWPLVLSICHV